MYLPYFGLGEPPFSITPDPRFVFLSGRHEDALAHLRYGISQGGGGGFVQLTGEVGTGKTTLSRLLLQDLPADTEAALVLNPLLAPLELLATICEELGIDVAGVTQSAKALTDRLNGYLLDAHAAGRSVVVLIDEAQNLSPAALEQVRLLTNLETARQKLLQIILLGQPELRELLARADLRQLAQRITARFHLTPLDAEETAAYVAHRLQVAGASRNPFTARALARLHQVTGGVPRLVNIVADRSLLAAYAAGRRTIDAGLVSRADDEVAGRAASRPAQLSWQRPALAALAVLALAYLGWWLAGRPPSPQVPELVAAVTAPEPLPAAGATPEPEPAEEADPRIATLPRALAFARLVDARGLAPAAAEYSACPWSVAPGVACLEQRGRLRDLLALDRPVMAALPDGWGVAWVDRDAVLWDGGPARTTLTWDAFEARWSGRYVDVWSMPGYVPQLLRVGERGPAVLWVKAAAARAEPAYRGDVLDPYFGPSLERWTLAFQQALGLEADGLIGRETLQRLSPHATDALP